MSNKVGGAVVVRVAQSRGTWVSVGGRDGGSGGMGFKFVTRVRMFRLVCLPARLPLYLKMSQFFKMFIV